MEYFSYFLAAGSSDLGWLWSVFCPCVTCESVRPWWRRRGLSNIVEHFWQLGRRCNDRHLYPPNSGVGKKEKFSINMVFSHNTHRDMLTFWSNWMNISFQKDPWLTCQKIPFNLQQLNSTVSKIIDTCFTSVYNRCLKDECH